MVNVLHKLIYHDTTVKVHSTGFILCPTAGNEKMTGIINLRGSNEILLIWNTEFMVLLYDELVILTLILPE